MKHYIVDRITAQNLMIKNTNSYESTDAIQTIPYPYILNNKLTLANQPIAKEKTLPKDFNISLSKMFSLTLLITTIFLLITSNYIELILLILISTSLLSLAVYKLVTIALTHKHTIQKITKEVSSTKSIVPNYNHPIIHLKNINQTETISGFDYFWNNNPSNSPFSTTRKIR